MENISRKVVLRCPTCGSDQFVSDETSDVVECSDCKRQFSQDELINENSEAIRQGVKDLADDAKNAIAGEIKDTLRKAVQGSKHIRFK